MFLCFNTHSWQIVWRVRAVIAGLLLVMIAGAFLIADIEQLPLGESLYFAFITDLTIGYGDIAPGTPAGRLISILPGVNGIVFTGLIVATAVHALQTAVKDVYSEG